jgi:Predicted signal-transduction protein containing cAMP-binding and CBS domains
MNVSDVMTRNPRTVGPGDTIQRAAAVMKEIDTGFIPVVEGGRMVGVVTDRDIVVRAVAAGGFDKLVSDVATRDAVFVAPGDSTRDAEKLMSERQIRRVAVVDQGRLVGVLSIGDLAVKEGKDSRTGETLESISAGVKH